MEFVREERAIRHYDQAGQMDAEITYLPTTDPKVIAANHTYVAESLRGQGVAGKLLGELVALAQENSWKIKAECSYVVKKFREQPEKYAAIEA
ncbi:GNAT family N-acetyltransferase [Vaginisenegalia massiliensis]|uniref:GNAT family N-acetyltransferase n=1 Tax=Vaginisenegalia massiliensis TaxID=2058294 RepID=UPI000F5263D0|nr:GNAT family N-acetyltransferase [Vaginisenegalia massiliensis]